MFDRKPSMLYTMTVRSLIQCWDNFEQNAKMLAKNTYYIKTMSVYGELDPMVEHWTQFSFKGKRGNIAKVNMSNIAYPNQQIDIEIPHGSRDHVIIPDTVKITFNLDIASTDKAHSVVNNVGRTLVKKKLLMLGSKDIDTINNLGIYDTYKDLYLGGKEREDKLLQGIQSANGLKARVGPKKADGTALTVTTQENAIKRTFDKWFALPLHFDFLSIHCIHMDLRTI